MPKEILSYISIFSIDNVTKSLSHKKIKEYAASKKAKKKMYYRFVSGNQ